MNNKVWVAIFTENSFNVVQLLGRSGYGADRQNPVYQSSNKDHFHYGGPKDF